ncbi:MAG: hypothetical protein AAGU21_17945 [Solidesulfovibrio sp.]|uniref:hypothetical protein n=1 Tax=Solidesulfovibrio sp. TaxID=2910990 RepID=UPI003159161D
MNDLLPLNVLEVNKNQRNDNDKLKLVLGVDKFQCKLFNFTSKQLEMIKTRSKIEASGNDLNKHLIQIKNKNVFTLNGYTFDEFKVTINDGDAPNVAFDFYSTLLRQIDILDYINFISLFFTIIEYEFEDKDMNSYLKRRLKMSEIEVYVDILGGKNILKEFQSTIGKFYDQNNKNCKFIRSAFQTIQTHKNSTSSSSFNTNENYFYTYKFFNDKSKTRFNQSCKTMVKFYNKIYDIIFEIDNDHWFKYYKDYLQIPSEYQNIINNSKAEGTKTKKDKLYKYLKKNDRLIHRIEYSIQSYKLDQWLENVGNNGYKIYILIDNITQDLNNFMIFCMKKVFNPLIINENGIMETWSIYEDIIEKLENGKNINFIPTGPTKDEKQMENINTKEKSSRIGFSTMVNASRALKSLYSNKSEYSAYKKNLKLALYKFINSELDDDDEFYTID